MKTHIFCGANAQPERRAHTRRVLPTRVIREDWKSDETEPGHMRPITLHDASLSAMWMLQRKKSRCQHVTNLS
jgi:hypothetical protein